jgi:hypothetical protein
VVTGVPVALHPDDATPTVAAPLNALFQVTVPDVEEPLMLPAEEGDMDQT